MRKLLLALGLWLALTGGAAAQTCAAYPFTFSPGTTIASSQVNSNFAAIRTCANSFLAPLLAPTFTGPVTITGTPLALGSGGTGATTAAGAIANLGGLTPAGGNLTGAINEAFATIASAATTNIGAAAANYLQVTGTAGITAFDTIQAGTERTLEFAGALTLTNSANIILLGGGNYTTAAGDVLKFRSEGAGVWRQVTLGRASGLPVLHEQVFTSSGTFTTPANSNSNTVFKFTILGGGGSGGGAGGTGSAGGGGCGGEAIFWGSGVAGGASVTVTVGSGGAAVGVAVNGNPGTLSSIVFNATTVTANGGGGALGVNTANITGGASGGSATNGTINITGGTGGTGFTNGSAFVGGRGCSGMLGGGGGTSNAGAGGNATGFGAGGGGGGNAGGGAGSGGIVIVEWAA